jgi:hypothetical protein
MKYANYDQETGVVQGYYTDDIHSSIPEPNVPLTEEEWQSLLNRHVKYINGTFEDIPQAELSYIDKRRAEYPDFRDYLDGIVKGDQSQINDYIAKCQAVKAKYPKDA